MTLMQAAWLVLKLFKNICMYFDEMTNIDGKEASHYAYSIPNGLQRARMES